MPETDTRSALWMALASLDTHLQELDRRVWAIELALEPGIPMGYGEFEDGS